MTVKWDEAFKRLHLAIIQRLSSAFRRVLWVFVTCTEKNIFLLTEGVNTSRSKNDFFDD